MEGSIQEVLATLQGERSRIDQAIGALEGLCGNGSAAPVKRRPGRPSKKSASALGAPQPKARRGKKAPRGLFQAKVQEVLRGLKAPVQASVLRDAVIKAGYPVRNEKSLYTSLFALAKKKGSGVKKTDAGFALAK